MILGASLLVSSAIQPLFGLLADRRATPLFLWGGVAVATTGMALAGLAGGYVGRALRRGLGARHRGLPPEAARVANRISGRPARRPASPGSWSAATPASPLGPLLAALAIPLLDERATLVFLVPGARSSLWLHHERSRLAVPGAGRTATRPLAPRAPPRVRSCC